MPTRSIALAVALSLVAGSFVAGACTGSSAGAAREGPSPKELIAAGALLIDVRSQGEWDGGHLDGARHLPVGEVEARADEVAAWLGGDKSKPVVLYCRSGNRSGRAQRILQERGFTNVVNGGGIADLR